MNRVLDRLFIGDSSDLEDRAPLRSCGFSAVVDLRDDVQPRDYGVDAFRLTNRDGDPWSRDAIETALEFIHEHIRKGRVLVACAAGISRSASMVIGYLVFVGHDVPTAYGIVRDARPKIAPIHGMLDAVLKAVLGVDEKSVFEPECLPVFSRDKG